MKKLLLLLSILIVYYWSNAQTGTLDPSFGNNGVILRSSPSSQTVILNFGRQCLLPDTYASGYTYKYSSPRYYELNEIKFPFLNDMYDEF